MQGMLTAALKGNTSLFKGLLTGVYRVAKEDIFSGLNNLVEYTVLDDFYSSYFGFTDDEVKKMLSDFNKLDRYEEIKEWYNGYKFGNTDGIYNPWSVINYISPKQPQAFWVNTSSNDLIRNLIVKSSTDIKEQISKLISGEIIEKDIKISTALRDITYDKEAVWSLFLFAGYLTAKEKSIKGLKAYCKLLIPNRELKELYVDIFETWLKSMNLEPNSVERLIRHLFPQDEKASEREFNEILIKVLSYHMIGNEVEKVYQAFILGMLSVLSDRFEVKSERENGFGKYDVVVIDKKIPRAVIMEFKVAEDEDLEKTALKALEQIEEKKYDVNLRERVSEVVKAGIALIDMLATLMVKAHYGG